MKQTQEKKTSLETTSQTHQTKHFDSTPKSDPANTTLPHDQIAARAYGIWQKNGCRHNQDIETWLSAESQLIQETKKK